MSKLTKTLSLAGVFMSTNFICQMFKEIPNWERAITETFSQFVFLIFLLAIGALEL